eukprot:Lankesteria_metandrocarpae@DN3567_c0_g1_i1.p1
MSDNNLQSEYDTCLAKCRAQGEAVRKLKAALQGTRSDEQQSELKCQVETLMELKKTLAQLSESLESMRPSYAKCRVPLDSILRRRFFIAPSFEIYGGVAGLYDFGPPGCALKQEIESHWRRHFILHEDMLEVSGTCLTPYKVLKASGHVDRFCDLLVKDEVTGDCYRADKLLEDIIDAKLSKVDALSADEEQNLRITRSKADGLSADEMNAAFRQLTVKAPVTGNDLTPAFPFNLMFGTFVGQPKHERKVCTGTVQTQTDAKITSKVGSPLDNQESGVAFLRPETAQGLFVNFRRLLDYNAGKLPFAAAQLGLGFRNEISPRNGLMRVREFQMAEIEHFYHPDFAQHHNFGAVAHLKLPLFAKNDQTTTGKITRDMTLGEAVTANVICNETLGYFMGRTYTFLSECGIQQQGLRFRQHLDTEIAHYARDCWDAEIETSYGWVECVGLADRSAYDLKRHAEDAKVDLCAQRRLPVPQKVEYAECKPDRALLGRTYQQKAQTLLAHLETFDKEQRLGIETQLATAGTYDVTLPCSGEVLTITRKMLKYTLATKTINEEAFVPHVVEPSFGIGRILYAILEHTFKSRNIEGQEDRCLLSIPPVIAPTKCSLLPISSNAVFLPLLTSIKVDLTRLGMSCKVDDSAAQLGRCVMVFCPFLFHVGLRE